MMDELRLSEVDRLIKELEEDAESGCAVISTPEIHIIVMGLNQLRKRMLELRDLERIDRAAAVSHVR